jgi:hypothetical protein
MNPTQIFELSKDLNIFKKLEKKNETSQWADISSRPSGTAPTRLACAARVAHSLASRPYGPAAQCRLALRGAHGAPARVRTTASLRRSSAARTRSTGEGDMAEASPAKGSSWPMAIAGSEEKQISHRSSCFDELRDWSLDAATGDDGRRVGRRRLSGNRRTRRDLGSEMSKRRSTRDGRSHSVR